MKKEQPKSTPSPYLDATRVWNERYGHHVASARSWRIATYLSLVAAIIATAGAIWLGGQKKVVPYAVEIDNAGLIQNVRVIGKIDKKIKVKIIKAQLAVFVEQFRNVVLDVQIQRKNVMGVYAYLRKNTPGFTKITEFYRENDPFERAAKETVFAEIIRIIPLQDNAWQVEWEEKIMDRQSGKLNKTINYKVIAYTTISPPKDDAAIIKNPLGLIITDLNWSKEI